MTNKEAAFLLGAIPPNAVAAVTGAADPEFAEALEQAGRDPALKAWFESQHRVDAAIAAGLQAVPVPPDLKGRILAGGRVSLPQRYLTARRAWAIAAMIALFAGLGLWFSAQRQHSDIAWEDRAFATLSDLLAGRDQFDARSPSVTDLQAWLRANGSPTTGVLPGQVARLASLGCKTVWWDGHPMSIICFHGPGGELVHLAMTDRAALKDPPPEGHPQFETRDGWRLACWSQGDMAMMLITKAPESDLRALLSVVLVP